MLAEGFEAEVRALLDLPDMSPERPAMRAVGYRQIARYVAGELTLDEAREQAIVATRRLAKRQLTWLRSWPDMHSVDSLAPECGRIVSGIVDSWPIHRLGVVQPPE
jgi:tRNA dimethylallyltransferase